MVSFCIEDADSRCSAVEVEPGDWVPVVVLVEDCAVAFRVAKRHIIYRNFGATDSSNDRECLKFFFGGDDSIGIRFWFLVLLCFNYALIARR